MSVLPYPHPQLFWVFKHLIYVLLAVVPHHLLSCCPCKPLPYHPYRLMSRHRLSPRAAPLLCWLVVASPLLNTASFYHALRSSLDIVVAAPPSLLPPAFHHRCRGDDHSLSRRILLILPATFVSLMLTSLTTTSSNPPMFTVSCPIVQSNPRRG